MKSVVRRRKIGNIPVLEVVKEQDIYNALPMIVYYHGWQTAKELVLTQGRKLAAVGFRVILPDAMNHGERKTERSKIPSLTFWQSIHTNLFEFDTIIAYFDKLNLTTGVYGVGGVSMGGMTTTALLTQHPEIQAAACVMGTPNLNRYKERIKKNAVKYGLALPKDYDALLSWTDHYDLAQKPETLAKRPIVFWHGTEDEKIPFEDVEDFIELNAQSNITFWQEQERHLVKTKTMDEITDFFVKHLLELN
ncbi:alpha/beta fold hydrolase [uncultured Enterococcus sp.]|uniref:alpha/beta fold hydrolase n=1 Tax=uncultured Enterococcus sp. TaxID=167972 RepID=UPI0025D2B08D|nr:alpha/beta fold hydrolase [uncultured Enterococcus sp.]